MCFCWPIKPSHDLQRCGELRSLFGQDDKTHLATGAPKCTLCFVQHDSDHTS